MSAATTSSSSASTGSAIAQLSVSARLAAGKGEAKRLRKSGQIPAIAYGKTLASTPIAVAPKEVITILKSEHGKNSVIRVQLSGAERLVMIRDYSYHPVRRELEHVDFVEVKLDEEIDVEIPLIATGKAEGVVKGGLLRQVYRTLPVRCRPDRIPLKIEVDVTPLELNGHIFTQHLKLDEGVSVRLPAEQTLIAVVAPEKDRSADEAAAAPGAAAAPAAAAAGGKAAAAPAKDAKAAAPAKDAKKK
ncbi:50S ribosomal protein L25 [Pendulispora albinea]|uniref:Large ribosomal subunit protein bL25 n=1 Tax=Pendulispora albinea TaxID=2741071 RepID=A0ABZ2LP92_9BACT